MTEPLAITACGLTTPLGRTGRENAAKLFAATRDGFVRRDDLVPGKSVPVGAVPGDLPEPPARAAALDCRNNRLMLAALDDIRPALERAIARYGPERIGVVLGSSTAGISDGETALAAHRGTGSWPTGFHYRRQEVGNLAEFVALCVGLAGPAYTLSTGCSSSAKVFASARRMIRAGLVDAAIVGGADTLCRMTLNGFGALEAVSPAICNPFSANRDGITIGEGAAAFLLEKGPGAVRLLGIGETSDAHHATAPDPEAGGAIAVMRAALGDAGLASADIAYVNLHGTATPLNDAMESRAIAAIFPAGVPCSSTKGMTGHMLGATGGVEAGFLWLTLHPDTASGLLPPHLWDGVPDPALPRLDLVAPGAEAPPVSKAAMMSLSFGFGGSNAALIFGRGWR